MAAIGVLGLAVMGQNLAMNIAEHGFEVSVFNRTTSKMTETVERARAEKLDKLKGYESIEAFVGSLATPKKIIIMVKAGAGVDAVMAQIIPHLSAGDIIIDGGNEYFKNTERRIEECAKQGFLFMGMGISGGEEGARKGPSLMPGGPRAAYDACAPILKAISAKAFDGSDCVTYIGQGGSGHFVKMVHNGIEYADMNGIADVYHVLRKMGKSEKEQADIFERWNKGDLASYLIEITAQVLRKPCDDDLEKALVSVIKPVAGSKGTGKWTVQEAADLGVPVDSIAAAFSMRCSSGMSDVRAAMHASFGKFGEAARANGAPDKFVDTLEDALWLAKVIAYTQGLMLLQVASNTHKWGLNMEDIARIWQGGCIIRAQLLVDIREVYTKDPDLLCLLLCRTMAEKLYKRGDSITDVLAWTTPRYIAVPGFSAAHQWLAALANGELPANLIQAQRDFFGAHTYERIDKDGTFHTQW